MARESKRKRDAKRFGFNGTLADLVCDPTASWAPMPHWDEGDRPEVMNWVKSYRDNVPNSKVIVADNVSEYYYATSTKEFWDINDDINCAAPPFEKMFIEMAPPSKISCGKKTREYNPVAGRTGYLLVFSRTDQLVADAATESGHAKILARQESERAWLWENCDREAVTAVRYSPDPRAAFESLGLAEKEFITKSAFIERMRDPGRCKEILGRSDCGGWTMEFSVVHELKGGILLGPIVGGTLQLDLGGRPVGRVRFSMPVMDKAIRQPWFEEMRSGINDTVIPALLTLCFMNCKNVSTELVAADPKLNRERRRAGLKPFLDYHRILIEQAERRPTSSSDATPGPPVMGMHIRRGHFSTYTEERPLFGRYPGTFWIPSHVVGSSKNGIVISDYDVKPPKS